jgi:hypothetical protein
MKTLQIRFSLLAAALGAPAFVVRLRTTDPFGRTRTENLEWAKTRAMATAIAAEYRLPLVA